jgi:hypothetical protein
MDSAACGVDAIPSFFLKQVQCLQIGSTKEINQMCLSVLECSLRFFGRLLIHCDGRRRSPV